MSDTTSTRAQRRTLQFNSIDDLIAELERIVATDRLGMVRATGNWTPGQIFNHLACWINYAYDGFPPGAHPPWFIRIILRRLKKKYVRNGMRPGVRIPGAPQGTFGVEQVSLDEGADALRNALQRLKHREPVKFHSPAFGEMTDDERIQLNLRHAELHLSFIHY